MRVIHDYREIPAEFRGAVAALGNFDGVHRGHQAVIGQTKELAARRGAPVAVVTFDPHPRAFFDPEGSGFQIASLDQKIEKLAVLGVDVAFCLSFDQAFSRMTAECFASEVLCAGLRVVHVVTGHDYRFGHRRAGDNHLLRTMGGELGFATTIVAPVGTTASVFSSTAIREALKRGAPEEAAWLLGAPWTLRGRLEGTALRFASYVAPAPGSYVVYLKDGHGRRCPAVARIGGHQSGEHPSDVALLRLDREERPADGSIIDLEFIRRLGANLSLEPDFAADDVLPRSSARWLPAAAAFGFA